MQTLNAILESREERLAEWTAQAKGDNPLTALRAHQMMELTANPRPRQKNDMILVAKVLEHLENLVDHASVVG